MVTGEIIETKIAESMKLGLDSIFLKVESETDKKELEHYSVLFSGRDLWGNSRKVHKCVLKHDAVVLFKCLGKKTESVMKNHMGSLLPKTAKAQNKGVK